jgi:hypothetical protein
MTATKPRVRGLIFSGPMVRALAAGRKTQTRRVVKPQPKADADQPVFPWFCDNIAAWHQNSARADPPEFYGLTHTPLVPGNVFYVREAFRLGVEHDADALADIDPCRDDVHYEADGPKPHDGWGKLHSPLHMPRWAARFWRRVTRVRLERVQDISVQDAIAEGCPSAEDRDGGKYCVDGMMGECVWFMDRWNALHRPPFAWGNNPWVWVYDFEPTEPIRESV